MATYEQWVNQAEKLEKDRNWGEAATLWERLRDDDRAIAAHRKAGHGERAARLLEAGGRLKDAAGMFMSVGMYVQAAGLYDRLHAFDEAARCYLRVNEREHAALMWEKAGSLVDAAKVFYSLQNFAKAAQLYESAGDSATAAQINEKHGLNVAAAQSADDAMSREYAALLKGDSGVYADERKVVAAVIYFLQAGQLREAAKIYSQCREDIGYPVMTAVTGNKELETALAKMLYAAKDFHKTAQVLENLEQFDKAAVLYERSDDFERAAEVYAKVGNAVKAAEMFERSGSYSEAADLYLQAGAKDRAAVNYERCRDFFLAGKLFYELRKGTKSLQLLQQVHRTEPRYLEASIMIGAVLTAGGYNDLAIKKLVEAVADREVDESTAPLHYRLGRLYEQIGNAAEARTTYEALLTFDFGYEDVQARVEQLKLGAPAAEAAPIILDQVETEEEATVVTMMDGFEFLKETKLFRELSLDETKTVYHLAEQAEFQPGAVLIEQDQPGKALYILRSGSVSVRKVSAGGEVELARLGPGSPIGEMSLFDDSPTSARVVATDAVSAFEISKENFGKLIAGSDRLGLRIYSAFVETLTQRLRDTTNREVTRQQSGG